MDGEYLVPDGIDPVVGWRSWRYTGKHLHSLIRSCGWRHRQRLEANCRPVRYHNTPFDWAKEPHRHNSPHEPCMCGIYALKDEEFARTYMTGPTRHTRVHGQVYLWGKTIEGKDGWRAQYAYPKSLVAPNEQIALALSDGYGVPVTIKEPRCS